MNRIAAACVLILVFVLCASSVPVGRAEPTTRNTSWEARVVVLEREIAELNERINIIERQLKKTGDNANRVSQPGGLPWRQLRKGMSDNEVSRLFGEPRKVHAGPAMTYWYYGPNEYDKYVLFDANNMTVDGWKE